MLAVCLRSLSCWVGNPPWGPGHSGSGFFKEICIFPQTWPVSLSLLLKTPTQHDVALQCFTVGMVLSRWRVVPGFFQTWCLELRPNSSISPEKLVSNSLWVQGLFCKILVAFTCLSLWRHFCLATLRSSDGSHLQTGSLELSQSDAQFLVPSFICPFNSLFPWMLSLTR